MSRPETAQPADDGQPSRSRGTATDHDEQLCQGCGSHVSADFRRVFAGNDGKVHACPACASMTDITNGATVRGVGGDR